MTQFAAARIGALLVAIDPTYKQAELASTLDKAGVSVLVMARAFRTADYAGMLDDVRPSCHSLRETIVLEQDWEAFLADAQYASGGELAEREASLQFDDAIAIQFTAGTTGLPKGATLSHHTILNNAYFTALQLGCSEDDRVCVPVPFSTGSATSSARSRAPRTAPASWCPASPSAPARCSRPCRRSAAPRSTACPRCSPPSSSSPIWAASISPACAPA